MSCPKCHGDLLLKFTVENEVVLQCPYVHCDYLKVIPLKDLATGELGTAGLALGLLVEEKNASYGDGLVDKDRFLKLFWPENIPPEHYLTADIFGRIYDKMKRIVSYTGAYGENPWWDIAGYALRMAVMTAKKLTRKETP